VTHVDLVAEDVREHDLGKVLLLLVAIQVALWSREERSERSEEVEQSRRERRRRTFELLADVGHLPVDTLLL
jgi:hypothetical protein